MLIIGTSYNLDISEHLKLCRGHGAFYMVGHLVDRMAKCLLPYVPHNAKKQQETRDGKDSFHITILSADELKQCSDDVSDQLHRFQAKDCIHSLGLAQVSKGEQNAWYVVIYSPMIQSFRQSLGFPEKDLHITLGFQNGDPHGTGTNQHLVEVISHWTSTNELTKIVINHCSSPSYSTSSTSSIIRSQELGIIRRVAYQLSDFSSDETRANDQDKIEVLKLVGKYALRSFTVSNHNKMELISIAEDIAWNMMDAGYMFGMRLLLMIFIKTNADSSSFNTFLSHFPLSLNVSMIAKLAINSKTVTNVIVDNIQGLNRLIIMGLPKMWDDHHKPVITFDKISNKFQIAKVPRNFSWVKLPQLRNDTNDDECHLFDDSRQGNSNCLLAGSAFPSKVEHLEALRAVGIRHILTIHEGSLGDQLIAECCKLGIHPYHFEVIDRTPPTIQQLKDMMKIMHNAIHALKEGLLVHCQGGVGRTNTAIIAYLMCLQRDSSASELTAQVADQRKLILSQSQQGCLRSWYRVINEENVLPDFEILSSPISGDIEANLTAQSPDIPAVKLPNMVQISNAVHVPLPDQSSASNYSKIANVLHIPPLILMCGVPASGKSTLSKAMVDAYPNFFVRINRDEMRGKGECDAALQKLLQPYLRGTNKKMTMAKSVVGNVRQCVILDGCHVSRSKRMEWLESAHRVPAWCIYFERPISECKERIQVRCHHPTIPAGTAGLPIIDSMVKQFEVPTLSEGFLRVEKICSDDDMKQFLSSIKIPFNPLPGEDVNVSLEPNVSRDDVNNASLGFLDKPTKFPRTAHAINLGAATRDDKVLAMSDLNNWIQQSASNQNLRVLIEEKVDGANIGFSIHPTNHNIIVQNRSHFITSQYHAQFSPLDKWILEHSQELWSILVPGRHILYGEWLYATHSVSYNMLPSYFIAYDLFDIVTNSYLPRSELAVMLSQTTISHVALIYEGPLHSIEHLKSFVFGPSSYGDEPREGIVIRICDQSKLVSRAKLVRPDFIAGNERWNRSAKLQTNKLQY